MPLLAFDSSTDHLSIAVQHGAQVWLYDGPGGAQASATLVPHILALLGHAGLALPELQAVVFLLCHPSLTKRMQRRSEPPALVFPLCKRGIEGDLFTAAP